MKNNLKETSRYLTLLLRHKPEKENLILDKYGYVSTQDLINKLNLSMSELEWIVDNNDKKRFIFNNDKSKIKANQGHSVNVDLNLKRILPPDILYHGTSVANMEAIFKTGLNKMSRHHVHLTDNHETAQVVAMRYAKYLHKVWIAAINAKQMNIDGLEFFKTENDVYLTNHVPSKYFVIDHWNEVKF